MIQRIQTVYMLIITVLSVLVCVLPLVSITDVANESVQNFFAYATRSSDGLKWNWGLSMISFIIPLIVAFDIFFFKHRIIQMRIMTFAVLLMVGFYLMAAWAAYPIITGLDEGSVVQYHIPLVFHIVNIILGWLAIRGIGKDEALVRSLNRLR